MYVNSKVKMAAVTAQDGLSNVLLLGESRYMDLRSRSPGSFGTWASGYAFQAAPRILITGAVAGNAPNASSCDPAAVSCINVTSTNFGSYHARGAFFALGDGSVQYLTNDVDVNVFRLLGRRDDGGTLP